MRASIKIVRILEGSSLKVSEALNPFATARIGRQQEGLSPTIHPMLSRRKVKKSKIATRMRRENNSSEASDDLKRIAERLWRRFRRTIGMEAVIRRSAKAHLDYTIPQLLDVRRRLENSNDVPVRGESELHSWNYGHGRAGRGVTNVGKIRQVIVLRDTENVHASLSCSFNVGSPNPPALSLGIRREPRWKFEAII